MLDIKTLVFVTTFVALLSFISMFTLSFVHKNTKGLSTFSASYLVFAMAFSMVALNRSQQSDFLSFVTSLTFCLGALMLSSGVIRFLKKDKHYFPISILMYVCVVTAFLYFTYVHNSLNHRTGITGIFFSFTFGFCIYYLKTSAHKKLILVQRLASIPFIAITIFTFIGGLIVLMSPEPQTWAAPGPTIQMAFVLFIGFMGLSLLGMTVLISSTLENSLRTQNLTDNLTQTYNRNALKDWLEPRIERAHARSQKLSLVMIDLDYFKKN